MNSDVVMINLDRPRQLRFTHTAMKVLVAMTGKTIEEIDNSLGFTDLDQTETMMYCALLKDAEKNGEKLDPVDIPGLLDEAESFILVTDKLREAWFAAFGITPEKLGNLLPVETPANESLTTGERVKE